MTDYRSRAVLADDLLRTQQTGDFAAQADALMALAELTADEMDLTLDQQVFGMLPALYMQACAAYQQAGDPQGMANAALAMAEKASLHWDFDDAEDRGIELDPREFMEIYEVALAICLEVGDQLAQGKIYTEMMMVVGDREMQLALKFNALRCYEAVQALPEQARILESLAWSYPPAQPEHRQYLERALRLYTQVNDAHGQKRIQQRFDYLHRQHKKRTQDILERYDKRYQPMPQDWAVQEISYVIRGLSSLLGLGRSDK